MYVVRWEDVGWVREEEIVCSGQGIDVKLRSEFDAQKGADETGTQLAFANVLFILEFRPQFHELVISNKAITSFLVFLQITCLCPRYEKHRGPSPP